MKTVFAESVLAESAPIPYTVRSWCIKNVDVKSGT